MFIDIHNHILPGIDDGPRDMADALRMARQAVEVGTDTMIATPHRAWWGRRDAPPDWVRNHVVTLQAALDREHIPLRIVPGVEIPLGPRVAQELTDGTLGTLGDSGVWALIEPPFERLPPDALDSLQRVREAGFQVVLAHPERNRLIQQDLAFVEACADLGLAFQLTSGSLLGRFGSLAQRCAEAILARAHEWPLVIASDAHDVDERHPGLLRDARDHAARLLGDEAAQDMVDARPRAMLSSAPSAS